MPVTSTGEPIQGEQRNSHYSKFPKQSLLNAISPLIWARNKEKIYFFKAYSNENLKVSVFQKSLFKPNHGNLTSQGEWVPSSLQPGLCQGQSGKLNLKPLL